MMVVIGHNDYVRYSETTGQQGQLAISFLLKWGVIVAAIIAYIVYVKLVLSVKKKPNSSNISNDINESERSSNAFDNIRSKQKLSSKADKIIDPDK